LGKQSGTAIVWIWHTREAEDLVLHRFCAADTANWSKEENDAVVSFESSVYHWNRDFIATIHECSWFSAETEKAAAIAGASNISAADELVLDAGRNVAEAAATFPVCSRSTEYDYVAKFCSGKVEEWLPELQTSTGGSAW
jgi:hypothetical protein